MSKKLIVNIKDKQTKSFIKNIGAVYDSKETVNYLYNHALDLIQNYFHVYLKEYQIFKGKYCTDTHFYWNVKPKGKKEFATIVIDIK